MDLTLIRNFYYTLLPEISPEEWQWLSDKMSVVHVAKGEYLFREGQVCRHVSFINKGLLCFYVNIEGKKSVNTFIGAGQYISDYPSFLQGKPGNTYLEAIEDSEALILSYDAVQEAYCSIPTFQKFGRLMAEYLIIMMDDHSRMIYNKTPEERYRQMLNESSDLIQRVPQYLIASYIGITPEALSRIRKRISAAVMPKVD
jgi:CRP-like cAMP-binding protein